MKSVILLEPKEAEFILDILQGKEKNTEEVKKLSDELQKKIMLAEGTVPLDSQK